MELTNTPRDLTRSLRGVKIGLSAPKNQPRLALRLQRRVSSPWPKVGSENRGANRSGVPGSVSREHAKSTPIAESASSSESNPHATMLARGAGSVLAWSKQLESKVKSVSRFRDSWIHCSTRHRAQKGSN